MPKLPSDANHLKNPIVKYCELPINLLVKPPSYSTVGRTHLTLTLFRTQSCNLSTTVPCKESPKHQTGQTTNSLLIRMNKNHSDVNKTLRTINLIVVHTMEHNQNCNSCFSLFVYCSPLRRLPFVTYLKKKFFITQCHIFLLPSKVN